MWNAVQIITRCTYYTCLLSETCRCFCLRKITPHLGVPDVKIKKLRSTSGRNRNVFYLFLWFRTHRCYYWSRFQNLPDQIFWNAIRRLIFGTRIELPLEYQFATIIATYFIITSTFLNRHIFTFLSGRIL